MFLSVIIPALNEEKAIGNIIERCLSAKEILVKDQVVKDLEVIVVSDGSTDRTVEIAKTYPVKTHVFVENQGYGAAIKKGWEIANGDLLAFIDADGTCDPLFFRELVNAIKRDKLDIALGSRMGPDSKMPKIRRVGNLFFTNLLKALSRKELTDSASGMH